MRNFLILTLTVFVALLVGGCAKTIQPTAPLETMNTAEHHIRVGWQMLEAQNGQGALQAFGNALAVSPDSSEALAGKSRALTVLGRAGEAFETASTSVSQARTPAEVTGAKIAEMHALSVFRPDDWLDGVRDCYQTVLEASGENAEATFLMANALGAARQYDEAAALYAKAVNLGGSAGKDAGEAWKSMQSARRLEAGQRAARDMARKAAVTRAEFSAILVEGLYLHQIIAAMKDSAPVSEFVTPEQLEARDEARLAVPSDVRDHALAADVMAVMALRLRGLEPLPDGRFRPDEPLTRAETAMALQDLADILGFGSTSGTSSMGASPFSDVPAGHYALDAIGFCVSHTLMAPRAAGRFEPAAALSGLEAVGGVQEIRNAIDLPREEPVAGEAAQGMSEKWKMKLFVTMLKSGLLFLI